MLVAEQVPISKDQVLFSGMEEASGSAKEVDLFL